MVKVKAVIGTVLAYLITPAPVFAQTTYPEIEQFTSQTLATLSVLASLVAAFFLIKGAYLYITSTGHPDALQSAKKTIKNALIGLVLVLSANIFTSLLHHSFTQPNHNFQTKQIQLSPMVTIEPVDGLSAILTDAIAGFLRTIIQSATKPLSDGLIAFLTTTPSVAQNAAIFNFWLVTVGITDSLFALVVALIGFQFMSPSTFGFEAMELPQLLPKIGAAFLVANTSIFLIDWTIAGANVLVHTVVNSTGGLNQAWLISTLQPDWATAVSAPLITLLFGSLFVGLLAVLILFYISRLIFIALGAVLSPLMSLLWLIPKMTDFAEIAAKTYLATIFTVFIHVVIIQLAASFLIIDATSTSPMLLTVLIGIGLLVSLIKSQSLVYQFVFYTSGGTVIKKIGGHIINVINTNRSQAANYRSGRLRIRRKEFDL